MVKSIHLSGERLRTTLNMILDLSRVEAQKIELKLKVFDIVTLLKETLGIFSGALLTTGLYLKSEFKAERVFVNIDERLFSDILNNLLKNAVIYTEKGGIVVTVEKELIDQTEWACIRVTDTGIGIHESDLDAIFEEFRQVSEGIGRGYEGTGLGLTLTKKYVELMNGTILVESIFGAGSTFTVKFPVAPNEIDTMNVEDEAYVKREEMNEELLEPLSVLVVEDDEITQQFIQRTLEKFCTIEVAETGEQAMELVRANTYDCILMDIHLGRGKSGVMVTKEIRSLPQYTTTPILAVTAFAMEGDREEFIDAGCTDYISKPFKTSDLIQLVKKVTV